MPQMSNSKVIQLVLISATTYTKFLCRSFAASNIDVKAPEVHVTSSNRAGSAFEVEAPEVELHEPQVSVSGPDLEVGAPKVEFGSKK